MKKSSKIFAAFMYLMGAVCIGAGISGATHQYLLAIPCLIMATALHLEGSNKGGDADPREDLI